MTKDRWQPFALHLSTEELEEIVFALRSTKPNPHGCLAKKSRARLIRELDATRAVMLRYLP